MMDWIIQYWVQVLFGLIALGFATIAKKFWSMYKKEKERDKEINLQQCYDKVKGDITRLEQEISEIVVEKEDLFDEEIKKVYHESLNYDKKMEGELQSLSNYIEVLKDGVLSVQGAHFRQQCKQLLDDDVKIISVDVFEQLTYDHTIYNKMGGNHLGDALYTAVEAKFKAQQLAAK